jgi:hypothetical protein
MKKYDYIILITFTIVILSTIFSLDFKSKPIIHKDIRWRPIKSHWVRDSFFDYRYHKWYHSKYEVIDSSVWDTFPNYK